MTGTRQLIEAIGQWRSCEEMSAEAARASPDAGTSQPKDLRLSTLGRTIEAEVIPRLMLAHREFTARLPEPRLLHAGPDEVIELARLVIEHNGRIASSYVDTLRQQGLPVEAIYIELLAPTARLLGEMWKADLCDFTDVTVGLSRLQQLVHELSPDFERESARIFDGRRALLVPMPNEQHTLGLMLIEEYFRRAGWDCCTSLPKSNKDLVRLVKQQHYDLVGLSASWGVLLDGIASAIQDIRKSSLNKSVVILVGGSIFLDNPEYVSRVGADGTAEDGRQAVLQLRSLLSEEAKSQ